MARLLKKTMAMLMVVHMSLLGLPNLASAAAIGTDSLIELDQRSELLSSIQAELAREEVRSQFQAMGVSPADIEQRIAALSTEELQMLADEVKNMPAGGDALLIAGIVILVLLILELTGITNWTSRI